MVKKRKLLLSQSTDLWSIFFTMMHNRKPCKEVNNTEEEGEKEDGEKGGEEGREGGGEEEEE